MWSSSSRARFPRWIELLIIDSNDVGSTGVFEPAVDGRKLTFSADGDGFVDGETGSRWNILGESVGGELSGSRLTPVVHANHFWFAWAAFKPDTVIYPHLRIYSKLKEAVARTTVAARRGFQAGGLCTPGRRCRRS